jgi:ADP-ribose pyrophosphatase
VSEQTLGSELIYSGKVVNLRVDRVRLRDGREARREVVEHGGAVAIVPVDADGKIILVRQFRTPAGASLLEVPAGGIDADEDPDAAVQRELQEETGYRAGRVRKLTACWVAPGYCTEFIHVYLAEGLVESRLEADEDEDIALERYTLAEALALIDSGAICDAKSIVGLLALARERAARDGR